MASAFTRRQRAAARHWGRRMTNKHKAEFALPIDGAPAKIRFTFDALAQLEEAMGFTSMFELTKQIASPSIKFLRTALLLGMQAADPTSAPKTVADAPIPDGALTDWSPIVCNAIAFALGIVKEGDLPNPTREAMGLPPKTAPQANGHDPNPSASPPAADSPPASASMN